MSNEVFIGEALLLISSQQEAAEMVSNMVPKPPPIPFPTYLKVQWLVYSCGPSDSTSRRASHRVCAPEGSNEGWKFHLDLLSVVCRGVELNPYIELLGNEYNNYSNKM